MTKLVNRQPPEKSTSLQVCRWSYSLGWCIAQLNVKSLNHQLFLRRRVQLLSWKNLTPQPTKLKLTNLTFQLFKHRTPQWSAQRWLELLLAGDLNSTIGSSGNRVINNNNMTFASHQTASSIYVLNFSTLDDAMHQVWYRQQCQTVSSPVENRLAKVNFTAVRIPKVVGNCKYTRKDSKDYLLPENTWARSTMFVKDSDYEKGYLHWQWRTSTQQDSLYSSRNDGSISSGGDLIALLHEWYGGSVYLSISNMGFTRRVQPFQTHVGSSSEASRYYYHNRVLNSGNEALRATVRELNIDYPDHRIKHL